MTLPETWFLLLVTGAFFLGGMVKGTIGLGLPLVAIAFMSSALTIPEALPIAALPILVMNAWQAMRGVDWRIIFRRLLLLNLFACIGIALGSTLLFELKPEILGMTMGVLLVIYVLINLVAVDFHVQPDQEAWVAPPAGLIGGVLFGMTGSLAVPIVPYLQALKLDKDAFVQAVGLVFFITAVAFVGALYVNGAFTATNVAISVGALIPSAIGMAIGTWIRSFIPQEKFRFVVYLFILLLGLNLIRKGIF